MYLFTPCKPQPLPCMSHFGSNFNIPQFLAAFCFQFSYNYGFFHIMKAKVGLERPAGTVWWHGFFNRWTQASFQFCSFTSCPMPMDHLLHLMVSRCTTHILFFLLCSTQALFFTICDSYCDRWGQKCRQQNASWRNKMAKVQPCARCHLRWTQKLQLELLPEVLWPIHMKPTVQVLHLDILCKVLLLMWIQTIIGKMQFTHQLILLLQAELEYHLYWGCFHEGSWA